MALEPNTSDFCSDTIQDANLWFLNKVTDLGFDSFL